jgi:hypothetical protein
MIRQPDIAERLDLEFRVTHHARFDRMGLAFFLKLSRRPGSRRTTALTEG